jgi:hypothetical protein
MVEEILDTRVMVKKAMKEHKNDKVREIIREVKKIVSCSKEKSSLYRLQQEE